MRSTTTNGSRYQQVAVGVAKQIVDGKYVVGEKNQGSLNNCQ